MPYIAHIRPYFSLYSGVYITIFILYFVKITDIIITRNKNIMKKAELKIGQVIMINLHSQKYVATIMSFLSFENSTTGETLTNHLINVEKIFNIRTGDKFSLADNKQTILKSYILQILD